MVLKEDLIGEDLEERYRSCKTKLFHQLANFAYEYQFVRVRNNFDVSTHSQMRHGSFSGEILNRNSIQI